MRRRFFIWSWGNQAHEALYLTDDRRNDRSIQHHRASGSIGSQRRSAAAFEMASIT